MNSDLEDNDEIFEGGPQTEPDELEDVEDKDIKYSSFKEAYTAEDSFWKASWEWLRNTANGRNKAGWFIGRGLDIVELIAPLPYVGKVRKIAKKALNLNTIQNEVEDMNWIKNRLGEKTTWRGIVAFATGVGISISPELASAIVSAGVSLVGVIEVYSKERKSDSEE